MSCRNSEASTIEALQLAQQVVKALEEKKGQNIVVLDVRGLSDVTDFTVVVTGTSPPHLKAMFEEIQRYLELERVQCYRKDGTPHSGWIVLDYVDVVIHIFSRKAREYFAIEELWAKAPRLM